MQYVIGTIMIALGFLIIWKSEVIFGWIGSIETAEKYLGVGESRLFIKLVGLILIVVAFLIMLGTVQDILTALFVR